MLYAEKPQSDEYGDDDYDGKDPWEHDDYEELDFDNDGEECEHGRVGECPACLRDEYIEDEGTLR